MKQTKPKKQKVTTVLEAALAQAAQNLSTKSGLGMADLLRLGLQRVVNEFRASGSIRIAPEGEQ